MPQTVFQRVMCVFLMSAKMTQEPTQAASSLQAELIPYSPACPSAHTAHTQIFSHTALHRPQQPIDQMQLHMTIQLAEEVPESLHAFTC